MMILQAAVQAEYSTDKGPVRSTNQDSLYFNGYVPSINTVMEYGTRSLRRFPMLFAVCDGMGGEKHGDEAAFLAAKLLKAYQNALKQSVEEALDRYADQANKAVLTLGRAGTTLVALALYEGKATVAHLGDSRAYLFREDSLTLLTEDHTQKRALGAASGQEPRSSVLTRHLGMDMHDLVIRPTYSDLEICRGDLFLLCSDGLTDLADKTDISSILKEEKHPARALAEAAIHNGSTDNTTVITVKIT